MQDPISVMYKTLPFFFIAAVDVQSCEQENDSALYTFLAQPQECVVIIHHHNISYFSIGRKLSCCKMVGCWWAYPCTKYAGNNSASFNTRIIKYKDHQIQGSSNTRIINTRIIKYKDHQIQGSSNTRIIKYKDHQIQGSSNTRIIKYKDHQIQGSSNTRIIKYKDHQIQGSSSRYSRIENSIFIFF